MYETAGRRGCFRSLQVSAARRPEALPGCGRTDPCEGSETRQRPEEEYTVRYQRAGDLWAISVPELDIHSQAASREEIAYLARDAIALTLDGPLGD
ncbi:hypothetical protein [Actinoplanes sp. NPDC049118]|uniref:type II toxin-antitoxin system HicB family antitoxin n=1 Tax=Actinoplanes sp. NPDC049118 TaxID=3155769 RepID=UPI003406B99A